MLLQLAEVPELVGVLVDPLLDCALELEGLVFVSDALELNKLLDLQRKDLVVLLTHSLVADKLVLQLVQVFSFIRPEFDWNVLRFVLNSYALASLKVLAVVTLSIVDTLRVSTHVVVVQRHPQFVS